MNKGKILNPRILAAIASLGHKELLCIADAGLPIPRGSEVIDVSISASIPGFFEVLDPIATELVVESFICAIEIDEYNPELWNEIHDLLNNYPFEKIPHNDFKELSKQARCFIRTGEVTPYANIMLIGGVNF